MILRSGVQIDDVDTDSDAGRGGGVIPVFSNDVVAVKVDETVLQVAAGGLEDEEFASGKFTSRWSSTVSANPTVFVHFSLCCFSARLNSSRTVTQRHISGWIVSIESMIGLPWCPWCARINATPQFQANGVEIN